MYNFVFTPNSSAFECNGVIVDPDRIISIYIDSIEAPLAKKPGRPDFSAGIFVLLVDHLNQPAKSILTCQKRETAENLLALLQELLRLKKKQNLSVEWGDVADSLNRDKEIAKKSEKTSGN